MKPCCVLLVAICNKIMAMHVPMDPSYEDTVAWLPSQDGNFSMKSAYKFDEPSLCVPRDEIVPYNFISGTQAWLINLFIIISGSGEGPNEFILSCGSLLRMIFSQMKQGELAI